MTWHGFHYTCGWIDGMQNGMPCVSIGMDDMPCEMDYMPMTINKDMNEGHASGTGTI